MATWEGSSKGAMAVANNFTAVTTVAPAILNFVDLCHRVVGPWPLKTIAGMLNKARSYGLAGSARFGCVCAATASNEMCAHTDLCASHLACSQTVQVLGCSACSQYF